MNWQRVALGHISSLGPQYGANVRAMPRSTGNTRYIRITDIDDDGTLRQDSFAEPDGSGLDAYRLLDGDIVIARSGATVGKSYLHSSLNGPCVFAGYLIRFRVDQDRADPKFVSYFLRSPEYLNWVQAKRRVAAQPNINGAEYSSLLVPLPALSEQRRIVEILDQADTLRKRAREADVKAARILPALFLKMFGDPATNPMGWPEMTIGEITTLVTSGLTPRGGASVYVDKGPMLIRSQNVLMNQLDLTDVARITPDTHKHMRRTRVEAGDVLLNITGASIGRVAWVRHLDGEANVNQHVCIMRPDADAIEPSFLSTCLSLSYHQSMITGIQTGASRQALNHQQVRQLKVAVPSRERQRNFAQREVGLHNVNQSRHRARAELESTFETLLQRAFSGQLTAKWREAHMQELLAEMQEQAHLLNLPAPN